jgi:hypothetical protein
VERDGKGWKGMERDGKGGKGWKRSHGIENEVQCEE